jgi:bifunctional ADP-heptose synthase (sugar kinase/adenylyltransferase)
MQALARRILAALDEIPSRVITVFGDFCLDKYLYIDPDKDEPSVETGLTAYQIVDIRNTPGACGTVANNLRALGAQVRCVGLLGEDGEGYDLSVALEAIGADTSGMVRTPLRRTNTYTKPMRRQPDGQWTELNRMDIRSFTPLPAPLEDQLIANLTTAVRETMGVVIVDQFIQRNCAAVTDRVRQAISGLARSHPDTFFFADSRRFIAEFRDVFAKCNASELIAAMNTGAGGGDAQTILPCGRALLRTSGKAAIVTMGGQGITVFDTDGETHLPAFRVEEPLDTVGAGDSVSAGIILGLTLGLSLPAAALLACCVSSITIQQIGQTGSASPEQVRKRLMTLL